MPDSPTDIRFDPLRFNSILNSHSSTSDIDCNIDAIQKTRCNYYVSEDLNDLSETIKTPELSLFHHNIRSLNKHSSDITNYLATINHTFNIYGFTETWFKYEDDSNLIDIGENYSVLNAIRQDRSGGGASLFIDPSIDFTQRSDLQIDCHDCDSIFIEITNSSSHIRKNIIIGIIYRPETVNLADFHSELSRVFDVINDESKQSYIMGDFNIDLLKCDRDPQVNDFINLVFSSGYYPTIDRPTRITETSISLIDNILTNDPPDAIDSGVLVNDISDHFPIFTITSMRPPTGHSTPPGFSYAKRARQLKPNNIKGFTQALSIANWNFVLDDDDAESAFNSFHDRTSKLFDIHCPIKTNKLSKRKTPKKPWITSGIIKSINLKDKLYRKYRTNPSQENKLKYTKYRNILNNILRVAKRNHITTELNACKNNMKTTWQKLNHLLGRDKSPKSPSHFNDTDDTKITDPVEIASKFNEFFTGIGPSLASKIPPPNNTDFNSRNEFNEHNIFLSPTTVQEITDIVSALKPSNSCGEDGISSKLLKDIIPSIVTPLVHIFNRSLATGVVPSHLKVAKVIPVFKSGDKFSFNNYRPISILPAISKILEKLVYKRIHDFTIKHNILTPDQFGFRPKHSTHMAINKLYDLISTALDRKLHTIGIFLDLSKAFDTLDHQILINKLSQYGIRGAANLWIKSYLENRKQYVVFNDHQSPTAVIKCGVPQGSILGPLLFLLYINDLPRVSPILKFIMFADDTNIIFSHNDSKLLETKLNKELHVISDWFKLNKLSLNIKKTNFMVFKNKYNPLASPSIKVKIDNKEIEQVKVTKFLGILIDDDLSWKSHTSHIARIVSKYNGIFRRIKPFLPSDTLATLYNTLVFPYLNYCVIIWGDKNNANINSLFLMQKRIIRTCTNSMWLAHTDPLFYSLKTLKVCDLYTFQTAQFMYRYHHNQLPPGILDQDYFMTNMDVHDHNTRSSTDYHVRRTNTKFAENTLRIQGAMLWNSLKPSLKQSRSLMTLKHHLKNDLLESYCNTAD